MASHQLLHRMLQQYFAILQMKIQYLSQPQLPAVNVVTLYEPSVAVEPVNPAPIVIVP